MKTEQIIILTPPIDGVQYGISETEKPKAGDFVTNPIEKGIYQVDEEPVIGDKKVICSTNPKDTRFPYLQIVCPTCGKREWGVCSNSWHKTVMPSKEQEIKVGDIVLWHMEKNHTLLTSNHKSRFVEVKAINEKGVWLGGGWIDFKDIEQLPTNPAKYTQEQVKKAITQATIDTARYGGCSMEEIIESLQPTAKAVRVEMVNEQETINYHKDLWVNNWKIKVETSSEYPQGLVKALEVIY